MNERNAGISTNTAGPSERNTNIATNTAGPSGRSANVSTNTAGPSGRSAKFLPTLLALVEGMPVLAKMEGEEMKLMARMKRISMKMRILTKTAIHRLLIREFCCFSQHTKNSKIK